ncbi:MAG: DUF1302 domain-containing protein [Alphaproteobacteria bacterium]|nr:DUF1302 domain-containing protein [Alphaproteobacteria bacterium]
MFKSKLRLLGVSALVGAGLVAAGPANAYNFKLGTVDVQIDTVASVGLSFRVEDRDTNLLASGNGGPLFGPKGDTAYTEQNRFSALQGLFNLGQTAKGLDPEAAGNDYGTYGDAGDFCKQYGTYCYSNSGDPDYSGITPALGADYINRGDDANYAYSSSINRDDGRLNFDNGDLTGGTLKATFDIEARRGNITAFARLNAFYDAVLMDEGSFERAGLNDNGEDDAGMNLQLLDAYVSADMNLMGMPLMVRAGKQVINWGEATFVPGGNSAFNSFDLAALRRPGAEIKEALLPVNAIYGSLAVTRDLTIEAYFGGWEELKIDPGGSPFAGGDSVNPGNTATETAAFLASGSYGYADSGLFPCSAENIDRLSTMTQKFRAKLLAEEIVDCSTGTQGVDVLLGYNDENHPLASTTTFEERFRGNEFTGGITYRSTSADEEGDQAYGLAVRYYAENLNSTEFGLYYQKYDSRIPYFTTRTTGKPNVTFKTTGAFSGPAGRGVYAYGCDTLDGFTDETPPATVQGLIDAHPTRSDDAVEDFGSNSFSQTTLLAVTPDIVVNDPHNLVGQFRALYADDTAFAEQVNGTIQEGALDTTVAANTLDAVMQAYCAMSVNAEALNAAAMSHDPAGNYDASGQMQTGELSLAIGGNYGENDTVYYAEYPEIEVMGASFNTTMFGWGVQGEVAYRPDMPLYLDSDAGAIGSIIANCGFHTAGGLASTFNGMSTQRFATINQENSAGSACTDTSQDIRAYEYMDVYNWDIGTTATFTRSNPVISALGADLGILLTEFAAVVVDGIEDYSSPTGKASVADGTDYNVLFANQCTSGSSIPLGSVFGLAPRGAECRPTNEAYGAVLFGQLQYNNVFGTPIALQPTLVYSTGLSGRAPAPAGSWREDNSTLGLSLNFSYLGKVSGSIAYRMHDTKEVDGRPIYSSNHDQDTLSLNVSYAY